MSKFLSSFLTDESSTTDTQFAEIIGEAIETGNYQYANYQCKLLKDSMLEFQENLESDEEVAIMLASFGKSITVHVEDIGYANPNLIIFYGHLEDGSYVELMQHINQINFLMVSAKKLDPSAPARRIGFTDCEP